MIDWTKTVSIASRLENGKRARATMVVNAERNLILAEFMDAVLADDKPALAKLKKYRDDTKAWLATAGGPDITKKPKRNGT